MEHAFQVEQEKGALWRQWLAADPTVRPCPIPRSQLTVAHLTPPQWTYVTSLVGLPYDFTREMMMALGLPSNGYHRFKVSEIQEMSEALYFDGRMHDGVICLENIARDDELATAHISDVAIALFRHDFAMETLKTVFITDIRNLIARPIIMRLYPSNPSPLGRTFRYATREYDILLGTPLGKCVGAIVLGAFGPGARIITGITVWWSGSWNDSCHMRFDIAPVQPTSEPLSGRPFTFF